MAEIIALIAGPMLGVLFTVIFTVIYQKQDFLRKQKLNIFNALMANRMNFSNLEFIRALAMIDVVFDKHEKVLEKWHGFYDAALNTGVSDAIRLVKLNEMLAEMARAVGYGSSIGFGELVRVYNPQALGNAQQLQRDTSEEFLRVLRESENFGTPRQQPPAPPLPPQAQ